MAHRRAQSYPPYYYVALVTVSHEEAAKAAVTAEKITNYLRAGCGPDTKILGPAASRSPGSKIDIAINA